MGWAWQDGGWRLSVPFLERRHKVGSREHERGRHVCVEGTESDSVNSV